LGGRGEKLAGIALMLGAVVAWSATGLYTRLITADTWTTNAGRSLAGAVILIVFVIARYRGSSLAFFATAPRATYWHALFSCATSILTIASLHNTTVANNAILYAASPFAAALLAYLTIGEKVARKTMLAATVSLSGVLVVVGGSVGSVHLVGDLLGVAMLLSFAVVIVIMRGNPGIPMVQATILNAVLNVVICAPLADWSQVDLRNAVLMGTFGFSNFVFAGLLFFAASRRLPAAEVALICGLDIVVSPLLVYLVVGEVPSTASFAGGFIVFAAVLGHIWSDVRTERGKTAGNDPLPAGPAGSPATGGPKDRASA
jgi:drug/metabolite transporter (DMT)-like permease